VAFVIGGLPFGGVENWLYDLCSRLETQAEDGPRIEAHVVNVSGTGLKAPEFERAGFRVSTCGADKSALKTSNLAAPMWCTPCNSPATISAASGPWGSACRWSRTSGT
jgi:hypothetical protein